MSCDAKKAFVLVRILKFTIILLEDNILMPFVNAYMLDILTTA